MHMNINFLSNPDELSFTQIHFAAAYVFKVNEKPKLALKLSFSSSFRRRNSSLIPPPILFVDVGIFPVILV